ncbi:amidase [Streptomyces sp. ME02-8801-2C]|uniref:amidase n=1 Tax=Streptomyces sp. ME02-8801-2C TaxID=3028680 RepID=UPI0029A6E593|nr:amidase [Streptomyces sp. ME02-8801-2C]MDX3451524.1 amidase [Streptomyces sp. ME02-8801-2C]
MTDDQPLWTWTATRLRTALTSRDISAREVTQSCLDRISEVNPRINALVDIRPEESLSAADRADTAIRAGDDAPLLGVPVATKINTDHRGYATTDGIVAQADNIATDDAPVVAGLRRVGAVFTGRSNSPAFGFRWFANNDLHGRTLNPWDAERTPGGSSGGAAAAVASGMVPIGHGNDVGGSIRYPSYATGLVGLRPTPGRVASFTSATGTPEHTLAMQTMAVEGTLVRCVADARLALDAVEGWDPRGFWQIPGDPTPPPSPNAKRVGLVRDPGVVPPSPQVDSALTQAARVLEAAGFEVEEVELPLLAEAYRLWYLLVLQEFATQLPQVRKFGDAGMLASAEHTLANAAEWWGAAPSLETFIAGYARRGTLGRQLQLFLERYPTLLLPVSAEQAMTQDQDVAGQESMRHVMEIQWPMMALPPLGVPALAVPTGVTNGLPVGVQLVGRRFDDRRLLDAGEVLERALGSFTPIDPR